MVKATLSSTAEYGIDDVCQMLGIQPGRLRMWERRYSWPCPKRGPNGYRIYGRAEVELLSRLMAYLHDGHPITELIVDGSPTFPAHQPRPSFICLITLPRPTPTPAAAFQSKMIEAIRRRNTGVIEMMLLQCPVLLHPHWRELACWTPALVGCAEWERFGSQLPNHCAVKSHVRSQVDGANWTKLQEAVQAVMHG